MAGDSVEIDPRLIAALAKQLEHRQAVLDDGAKHVGWKLGMGDRESIGGEIAVGHLTAQTVVDPGGQYRADFGEELYADAEAVAELGREIDPRDSTDAVVGAIARYGAALEIVDLRPFPGEPETVVVANVFHRAVAFSDLTSKPPADVSVSLSIDSELRAVGEWPNDLADRISRAARILETVDERLRQGDRIITGSIVQVPVETSNTVVARVGDRAAIGIEIVSGATLGEPGLPL